MWIRLLSSTIGFVVIVLRLRFCDGKESKRQYSLRGVPTSILPNRTYKILDSSTIHSTLQSWSKTFPDLIRVTTAQKAFGIPTAGGTSDCPFDDGVVGCLNYFAVLQDFKAHPEGSRSSNELPEVLWSGELHGDERIGPTAVMEAAQLLLNATTCESYPRISFRANTVMWNMELLLAKKCREDLQPHGINDSDRKWLARLLSTRRIILVPTVNALGYYRKVRVEDTFDPNRDFPYDVVDSKACMNTMAARTMNEIFRQHMVQMSLTFHAGIELIGYEWGATSWIGSMSPDDIGQDRVSESLSRFGGSFLGTPEYAYGSMNEILYAVRGGFEDWAYAGSFDPARVIQCSPTTLGGYSASKTQYTNSTLRAFNLLVETSNFKTPVESSLGAPFDIINPRSINNGHVPRNIRVSLLSVDVVEPYVTIIRINNLTISDDIVPLVNRSSRSCQNTKAIKVASDTTKLTIEWVVGGALDVDSTSLWFGKWDNVPSTTLDCIQQPRLSNVKKVLKTAQIIGSKLGYGKFAKSGPTTFRAIIDLGLEGFVVGDKVVFLASAAVDKSWAGSVPNTAPAVPPQSHIVNVRTNPNWLHESNGKIIRGRRDWFSIPLTVGIGWYKQSDGITIYEQSNRFGCLNEYQIRTLKVKQPSLWKVGEWKLLVDGSPRCTYYRSLVSKK